MKARARVIISGYVQGVFFRLTAEREASSHGVKGWVMNQMDGRVEAVFEGEKDDVEHMVRWCHHGPPYARVSSVDVEWQDYTGEFRNFRMC